MKNIREIVIILWITGSFIELIFGHMDKAIFALGWAILLELDRIEKKIDK